MVKGLYLKFIEVQFPCILLLWLSLLWQDGRAVWESPPLSGIWQQSLSPWAGA